MLVADANVVVTALVGDGRDADDARNRLWQETAAAPELLDIEVLSVLRRLVRTSQLSAESAAGAIADLASWPIERYRHGALLPAIWELRENVTAYDAAYVALARATDSVLLTADAPLVSAAGRWCSAELFTAQK